MGRLPKTPTENGTDQYMPPKKFKHTRGKSVHFYVLEGFWGKLGSEASVGGVGSFLLFTQSQTGFGNILMRLIEDTE